MKFYWKPQYFQPLDPNLLTDLKGRPLASFRRRVAAWTIDIILILTVFIGLYARKDLPDMFTNKKSIQIQLFRNSAHHPDVPNDEKNVEIEMFKNPWGLALIVAYFGLMTRYACGRTIGKRVFRIRVASIAHGKLTLWQCVERALGYGFSSLEGGFGFIQYFLHPNRQTLHDRIAETVVIWEGEKTKTIKKKKFIPSSMTDDGNRD